MPKPHTDTLIRSYRRNKKASPKSGKIQLQSSAYVRAYMHLEKHEWHNTYTSRVACFQTLFETQSHIDMYLHKTFVECSVYDLISI